MKQYLGTDDEKRIQEVSEKASILAYMRLINKYYKKGAPSAEEKEKIKLHLKKISGLLEKYDTLEF